MKNYLTPYLLLIGLAASAQDFYDLNTIQKIEITFEESNWDQLLDAQKAGDEDYIMAKSVAINGVVFDSVGVKYKGNSTYNANQTKNPFHIELDTYKDHIYENYTDIKLSNVAMDPSFVREVLSYQILRQYMDAPLSNYANVYVNGTLLGLYSNSEAVSKKFVDSRFYSKRNTFIKCNPPAGAGQGTTDLPNLVHMGSDSADYYDSYELKSDDGWSELIDLCSTLDNEVDKIAEILDVDRALWMLAFNNVVVNLDSYIGGFAQNYYLYRSNNGRFMPVVWDLNESFGRFSQTGSGNLNSTTSKQQMSHLLHENDADYPLVYRLLDVPMYKNMYLDHCKTILLENFDDESYYETAQVLQTSIDASVQADVNKFFTYDQFVSNLTSDVAEEGRNGVTTTPGISSLMNGRSSYLLSQADFTEKELVISEVTPSETSPLIGEKVTISATVSDDALIAYLGYRNSSEDAFTRIEMYDDGTNGDVSANDGSYGVEVEVGSSSMQYYIYAENDDEGTFSPARAEYEFYNITGSFAASETNGLVINEFMASNDFTAADQDGEYDDWIELYNYSESAINLEGYFLSDDADNLAKWTFPAGTSIGSGSYLIVWADEDEDQEGLHASFKLSASAESIFLTDASSAIVDEVSYTDQNTDISYGRMPNGTGDFETMDPTFGTENGVLPDVDQDGVTADLDCDDNDETIGAKQDEGTVCDDGNSVTENDEIQSDGCTCAGTNPIDVNLVINELLASNSSVLSDQDGEFDDWIELYNNGAANINLDGYFLSDDIDNLTKWEFPTGTLISATDYLLIWADEDNDQEGLHADFKLSAASESVYLVSPEGLVIDEVSYTDQTTNISYGRIANGTGDFRIMNPSPNAENLDEEVTVLSNELEQLTLSVYPNPSTQYFHLTFNDGGLEKRNVVIYDLLGNIVFNESMVESLTIDISQWSSGMYIIQAENTILKVSVY